MTQVWVDDKVIAVTAVQAGPCVISQLKNKEKDGYSAIQFAFGNRKEKNIKKPQIGHFKASGVKPMHVKEFRVDNASDFNIGDTVSVGTFAVGDNITVTGVSKGRGFQGVVKRHGFHGFKKTHGNKDQERMPGSIGAKGPAHVFKGTKMGGRMGTDRVTISNLEVIAIDEEKDLIFVKGGIPGAVNSLIMITGSGEMKVNMKKAEEVVEEKAEEVVEEKAEEVVEEKAETKVEEKKEEEKVEEKKEEEKVEEKKEEEVK